METGRQIWRTPVRIEAGNKHVAFNRGAATIYNGKLFRMTIDDHVLALDMKTGKEIWNQKFANTEEGYYATGGPIVANGVLISGASGRRIHHARFPRWVGPRHGGEIVCAGTPSQRRANLAPETWP